MTYFQAEYEELNEKYKLLKSDMSILTAYMEQQKTEIERLNREIDDVLLSNINLRKKLREYGEQE